ncbi:MAG: hypothetical protein DWQ02_09755 [Bacteroidetes bacterium]|nr:MAG: hypothetical protein DWQ02_09755 [Bacteroidota bacterium]
MLKGYQKIKISEVNKRQKKKLPADDLINQIAPDNRSPLLYSLTGFDLLFLFFAKIDKTD